jgi:hypothetical protein
MVPGAGVPEPCLIEEIEVPVLRARVNQARSRIDKQLRVRVLISSDRAISIRGLEQCKHSSEDGIRRGSYEEPRFGAQTLS